MVVSKVDSTYTLVKSNGYIKDTLNNSQFRGPVGDNINNCRVVDHGSPVSPKDDKVVNSQNKDPRKSSSSTTNTIVNRKAIEGRKKPPRSPGSSDSEEFEETPFYIPIQCYFWYAVQIIFGHLRDFLRATGIEKTRAAVEKDREDYVSLYKSFESFYTRNIYRRICHAWNQPIASRAGEVIDVLNRKSNDGNVTLEFTGTVTSATNFGSYNYLGFAENSGLRTDAVESIIKEYGVGVSSSRHELGTHILHSKLEQTIANFLSVEDAMVFGMGFATNSTNIPTIAGKGCLIISDELNHASMILGIRLSGAAIRVFKHNNMTDLEKKLRQAIIEGQPRSHRPWKKIIIFVEGVYSMEGTAVNLPEVIALKKKYKAYLYLDEAHSIGAMGPTGRGIIEYFDCDPKDVDLLMGTFTKSFGAAGGYIAGSKQLIDHIRIHSHSFTYATSMAPPVAQQVISVLETIDTPDGKKRIETLRRNSIYFRKKLKQLGFIVYGREDSPVVPLMTFFPSKICSFVHQVLPLGVAVVGAGFPATSLITARVRFCLSAAHTKKMLDQALEATSYIGDKIWIKYSFKHRGGGEIEY